MFYISDSGLMVHRVASHPRRGAALGYVLTFGDNCLVPDPPVRTQRLLGTVIAIKTASGWRPPDLPVGRSLRHQLVRGATWAIMVFAMSVSIDWARRMASTLRALQRTP